MTNPEELIKQPISTLDANEQFISLCGKMGFEKIEDILALPSQTLIYRHGFSFHWLSELISLLQAHHALHLLQPALKEKISG